MVNFEKVIEELLKIEGGYVNHPNDKGGPTNWGITIGVLSEWRGRKVTIEDMKALPQSEAKLIYKKKYWDAINLDKINSLLLAKLVFDQSVNRGPVTAAKNLQESYNNISPIKLVVDGKIGSKTLEAINKVDPVDIAVSFFKDAQLDYATIVQRNTSQAAFIRGWTNRTHLLLDDILLAARVDVACKVVDKKDDSLSELLLGFFESLFGGSKKTEDKVETSLADMIVQYNPMIEKTEIERALTFLDQAKKKDHMLYVDFDLHSKDERAYLIDLKTGKSILKDQTTVGKYSDADHDGWAEAFGNVSGSGKSSLGAMLSAEAYGKSAGGSSKFMYAQKLDGLEPLINGKVRERFIVIHDSQYAESGGRSLGCITFNQQSAKKVIETLGVGSLVYCNHESLKTV